MKRALILVVSAASACLALGSVLPYEAKARTPGGIAAGAKSLVNQAGGPDCVQASTNPTVGMLYPLSNLFCVRPNGNVGIGTTNPVDKLHVAGGGLFSTDNRVGATPMRSFASSSTSGRTTSRPFRSTSPSCSPARTCRVPAPAWSGRPRTSAELCRVSPPEAAAI